MILNSPSADYHLFKLRHNPANRQNQGPEQLFK